MWEVLNKVFVFLVMLNLAYDTSIYESNCLM